jgi:3-oxoacyl-[acyl-carrier protein] reductase
MLDFQNRLAVIFGGGRDIGGAVAVQLARCGAQVAFSYHNSDPVQVTDAIIAVGQTPFRQKLDAMDMDAVRAFAASFADQAGKKISVLINVVGSKPYCLPGLGERVLRERGERRHQRRHSL